MPNSCRLTFMAAMASVNFLASPPSALAATVWAKTGSDLSAMEADLQDCTDEAQLVGVQINMGRTTITAPGGVMIGLIIGAGFSAALKPKAQAEYVQECMSGRRYGEIPLSPSENADLSARTTADARNAWVAAFYNRTDFDRRRSDVVPLIAQVETAVSSEPFTFGAARFDPAALTVASGEIDANKAIVSGPISHRATGRISMSQAFSGWRFDKGLIVQKVVISGPQGSDQVYWCGKVSKTSWDGANDHCFRQDASGVLIFMGRDTPWLDRPSFLEQPGRAPEARFVVEESPTDLIGAMNFGLYLKYVSANSVRVLAEAELNGKYIDFWAADLPFDSQGKAVLPFWSDRLTLTRSGNGVSAELTKDGDGKGWEAVKDTSSR